MSLQKHTGGCQWGNVGYEAGVDLGAPLTACNCSMCGRSGTLLSFVPEKQFTLLSGEPDLGDYLFNKEHIHHLFCKRCGIKSFARGAGKDGPMIAVNARCLDGVDIAKLKVNHFDGKSM